MSPTYSTSEQKNYKDANLREVAREKVNAARAKSEQKTEDQAPKYRDRASERRVMHNQPDAPAPSSSSGSGISGNGRRCAPGPPKPPSPPPPPLNPGRDENNVGNKLLKIMGWTEGTGLGTNGEGRVDPMYAKPRSSVIPLAHLSSDKLPYMHKVWDSVHPRAKTLNPYLTVATLRTTTFTKWRKSVTTTPAEIARTVLLDFSRGID